MKEIKATNLQDIGTYFKKENIVLATIQCSKQDTKGMLEEAMQGVEVEAEAKNFILDRLIDSEAITSVQVDIFYQDEKGYTRFADDGPETFVGDDSDGKGIIRNVVPVWDYYSETELVEATINGSFIAITITNDGPLRKYNQDYNGWD